MKLLKDADLQSLISAHGRPCISMYFSFNVHDESDGSAEHRYQDLVAATRHALNQHEIRLLDERLMARIANSHPAEFLEHTHLKQGILCIFISPSIAGYLLIDDKLPTAHAPAVDPTTVGKVAVGHPGKAMAFVGDHFHLTPILPLIQHDDSFLALVIGERHICLYLGNSAEFILKDRIAFPFRAELKAHDQQANASYALLLKQGLKPEVANHIINEQDRNPDLWSTISIDHFMKTSQQVIRAIRPFIENSERVLLLSGASQWVGILRAVLASTDFISARTHHKTIGQLPAMPADLLAHRARELVKSTLRQSSLMAWNKARHQPSVRLYSQPDEIKKSVDEGRSEILFTAPDCHSVDGAVEAVLNRRGRVYVIDPHDLKFAAASDSLGIPASLAFEARRDLRQNTLERSKL